MNSPAPDAAGIPGAELEPRGALLLKLLSTLSQENFDPIARVAASALRAPAAFLTLIDDEEGEITVGAAGAPTGAGEHSGSPGLGRHIVESRGPLAVNDAAEATDT